jgi:UDP-glucuronate decarboxylase
MYTVLVSGGGGFIGKNLVKHLLSCTDFEIIVIDNFISSVKTDFCTLFENDSRVKLIIGDITLQRVIDQVKDTHLKIDYIYHLASIASPTFYKRFPKKTLDVGYLGTKNMLELTKHYKCKFLFTSTSEVYGDPLEHPQKETYFGNVNCYGERSMYDESKRVAEALVFSYRKIYSLDTRIVRIFNTFGPYMNIHDGRIVTEIAKSLILGFPLTIHGNGEQTRSLCYVDDTIKMMVSVMNSSASDPINIGNDIEMTINELVKLSCQVFEKITNQSIHSTIKYSHKTQDDPQKRKPCLDLYYKNISAHAFVPLHVGIRNTLLYFYNKN